MIPQLWWRRIYEFLEVDTAFLPPSIQNRFNISGIPRVKFINNLFLQRNAFQRSVRKAGSKLLGKRAG